MCVANANFILYAAEPERGSHAVPFAATLYIDADDFRLTEEAPKGFKRLTPAQPVGLVNASVVIAVEQVIKASALYLHARN